MAVNKEQIATGIAASATLFAGTVCLDPNVAGFVFGVGGNLIANILQWGAREVSGHLGEAWMHNHDIRNALKCDEAFLPLIQSASRRRGPAVLFAQLAG